MLADNRELENIRAAPVHGEEPSVKSIRRHVATARLSFFVLIKGVGAAPINASFDPCVILFVLIRSAFRRWNYFLRAPILETLQYLLSMLYNCVYIINVV